jgi:hypothetical protein
MAGRQRMRWGHKRDAARPGRAGQSAGRLGAGWGYLRRSMGT